MTDDRVQDRIDALRTVLGSAAGPARIVPLMELARLHSERFQRDMQSGGSDAHGDLDATIATFADAHKLMAAGDPYRRSVAHMLGVHLSTRFITRSSTEADRDSAIDLFEECLRLPGASPSEIEISHFYAAQLLMLRGFPDAPRTVDGIDALGALAAVSRSMSSMAPTAHADLDRAIVHLQAIVNAESVHPQIAAAAPALLSTLTMLTGFFGGGGMSPLFDVVRDMVVPGAPGTPGATEIRRMQETLLGRRLDVEVGTQGPLQSSVRESVERGSGLNIQLSSFMREHGRVTRDDRIGVLSQEVLTAPLTPAMLDTIGDATVVASAYPGAGDADKLVEIARSLVERVTPDPIDKVVYDVLLAAALALRATPDDIREAEGRLVDALTAAPSEHPTARIAAQMLVLTMDDRHPLGGVLRNPATVVQLRASVGAVVDTPVVRGVRAALRVVEALDSGDVPGVNNAVDELDRACAQLPAGYPWVSRLRAVGGVALLGSPHAERIRRGVQILAAEAARVGAHHRARPAVLAVAGYAALHAARTIDALPDDAIDLLSRSGSDGVASARLVRARSTGEGVADTIRLLERASTVIDPATSAVADVCRIGGDLAEAYRLRGDAAQGDQAASVHGGLDTLRTMVTAAAIDPTMAAEARALADKVAVWSVADGWPAGAAEAIELRCTVTDRQGGRRVPYGLRDDGVSLVECRQQRTAAGLPDVVTAPRVAAISAALRTANADALVYLTTGLLTVVSKDGRVSAVPAPGLRTHPNETLDEDCEGAWTTAFGPLDAHLRADGRVGVLRLILVPTGELGRVPWHAAHHGSRYACADYAITYAASGVQFIDVAGRSRATIYERPVLVGGPDPELLALRDALYPNAPVVTTPDGGATMLHFTGDVSDKLATPYPGACIVSTGDGGVSVETLLVAGAVDVIDRGPYGGHRPPVPMVFMIHHFMVDRGYPPAEALRRAQLWMLDPHRETPDHMPEQVVDAPNLADVNYWAGLRHWGG